MTYVLVKQFNNYKLYSPDTCGMETWGSDYQLSLEKKRKNWYLISWTAGNEYTDDETYKVKVNVVFETKELSSAIKFIEKNNPKQLVEIVETASKILQDKAAFDSWTRK